MINHAEIRARARRLGLDASHVENDYVLSHLLVSVCEGLPELVFRGGSALAHVYWPDYRLSEDLDFTSQAPVRDLEARLQKVVRVARERTTLNLELTYGSPRGSWRGDRARTSCEVWLSAEPRIHPWRGAIGRTLGNAIGSPAGRPSSFQEGVPRGEERV